MPQDNPLYDQRQIVEFLQQVGGFSLAEEASLEEAALKAVITTYKEGALIIKQGELGNDLHVIVKGRVQVPLGTQSQQQNATVDLGPGNVVGEMGFFDQHAPNQKCCGGRRGHYLVVVTQRTLLLALESPAIGPILIGHVGAPLG